MAGHRWVRLDVDYFQNPKTLAAGPGGRGLHLASICWSGRYLTDGHIPGAALPSLLGEAGVRRPAADRLVEAGLWVPNGDGFHIHDYTEMNSTRSEIESERISWRERQQRSRNRKHASSRDDE